MDRKDSLTSLFGRAKKWAQEEIKNATRVGGDPNDHRRARIAQDEREHQLRREAERATGTAVVNAMFPKLREFQDTMDANRVAAEAERDAAARADRERRAGAASVQLSGALAGELDGLAVSTDLDADSGWLLVTVETIDSVSLTGGTFAGFSFALPQFHGDGSYSLVEDETDWMNFTIFHDEDDEGWFAHPSYGPSTFVVADGVADASMTFGNASSDLVRLRAQVRLDA